MTAWFGRHKAALLGFGIVGAIGFLIDAGVLTLLSQAFGWDVYVARLVSFIAATLGTWLLNRSFVFARATAPATDKRREYGRYFLVQTGGALLNLGVFSALIACLPALRSAPVVPLAFGSGVAMFFNYAGSRRWVFQASAESR